MRIGLEIERADPLAGTIRSGRARPVRFEGWLELLRSLSVLIGLSPDGQARAGEPAPSPSSSAPRPESADREEGSG